MNEIPAKSRIASVLLAITLIVTVVILPACTSATSPIPTPAPTTTAPTATPVATYQTLADAGKPVYSSTCAVCHGANGEGTDVCTVVIWGSGSGLGTFNGVTLFSNAREMLRFTSTMPITAPGSLISEQYIELLAYILIQNKIVTPSTIFDESKLGSISIP